MIANAEHICESQMSSHIERVLECCVECTLVVSPTNEIFSLVVLLSGFALLSLLSLACLICSDVDDTDCYHLDLGSKMNDLCFVPWGGFLIDECTVESGTIKHHFISVEIK
jgi:hypothetical protein